MWNPWILSNELVTKTLVGNEGRTERGMLLQLASSDSCRACETRHFWSVAVYASWTDGFAERAAFHIPVHDLLRMEKVQAFQDLPATSWNGSASGRMRMRSLSLSLRDACVGQNSRLSRLVYFLTSRMP